MLFEVSVLALSFCVRENVEETLEGGLELVHECCSLLFGPLVYVETVCLEIFQFLEVTGCKEGFALGRGIGEIVLL